MELPQLLFKFVKICSYIYLGTDDVVMPCHILDFTDIFFFYPKTDHTASDLKKHLNQRCCFRV